MANLLYDNLFGIHAQKQSNFIADPSNATTISYTDFIGRAAQFAHVISNAGLKPGDRLIVQIEKSISALALYAGCVQCGVVYLPLNNAYTHSEVDYFINDSGASLFVCDPNNEENLQDICNKLNTKILTICDEGKTGSFIQLAKLADKQFNTVERSADDLAALLYTSGTTGRSKGAMLTHENLLSNAQTLTELWQFTEDDVLLHALPIFHTHGLFVASNVCFLAGAQMILEPTFDVDRLIELLPHATCFMGVPTFYTRLLNDERLDKALVSKMRLFVSGSAPLLSETHTQFEHRTGQRILERYGMTETNMNTSNPYDGERRAGTVGFPLPGVEVHVCDETTGEPVATGEIGQLEVRGPNVFKGYWNMPEKTAEELRDNGFFITGDLAQVDSDGYISIVGRNKDLIISGGYNIYPKEVELLIDAQANVVESAVVGVPHPDFGETPIAIIVTQNEKIVVDQIEKAVSDTLARFKQPKKWIIVDSLPRNTMGKVQKNVLRESYKNLFN